MISGKLPALLNSRQSEPPQATLERLRRCLPRLKEKYGAFRLWLVNPYALTEPRKRPVFLVELSRPLTLVQFIGLEQAISRAIGKKALLVQRQQYFERHGEQGVQSALTVAE